jgi:hypothetical protein
VSTRNRRLSACGWPVTSGRPPAAGRHLDSVILLKFFYFLKRFLKLAFYTWKCKILHFPWRLEISRFLGKKNPKFRVHLSYQQLGFLVHEKLKSLKIPQDLLVLWKFFVPFFSARCIWVCSTHLLPLRFGTQVPNMMCMTMVQKLKVV